VIGLAAFGAAVLGVLVLVVRLGRGSPAPSPPPMAPLPNRFGLGAPAPDANRYAVSAAPAGVATAPPPAAPYAPPPQPFAAQPFAPQPYAPPGWSEPAGRSRMRPPFLVALALAAALVLGGVGLGVKSAFFAADVTSLRTPAELAGVPLASHDPRIAASVDEMRRRIVAEGTRDPLVAVYAAPGRPMYVLAAGSNQRYETREAAVDDFAKGFDPSGPRILETRPMTTPQGHELDCFRIGSARGDAISCIWKHRDTAGIVMAFGGTGFEQAASVTGEAMAKSGV
jgi:hypothetical protein